MTIDIRRYVSGPDSASKVAQRDSASVWCCIDADDQVRVALLRSAYDDAAMSDIDHLAQMESAEPTVMSSRNVSNFAKPAIGLLCDVSIVPRAVEDGDVHDEALAAARPLAQRSADATRRAGKALND